MESLKDHLRRIFILKLQQSRKLQSRTIVIALSMQIFFVWKKILYLFQSRSAL